MDISLVSPPITRFANCISLIYSHFAFLSILILKIIIHIVNCLIDIL
nr:MAG TPA: hypothetical protein [Bacteriophage sp.]